MSDKTDYGAADMADVADNPEWTREMVNKAKPFAEVFPELARKMRGRPRLGTSKVQVTLRLDADIVERFKSGGAGWQSRINETLKKTLC